MNPKNLLDEFGKICEEFQNVHFHKDCIPEILGIVLKSGYEREFLKQFLKLLKIAAENGEQVVGLDSFEILKYTNTPNDIYAMKLKSKRYNIRILYTLNDISQLYLHCFYERQGDSKTDYTEKIPIAIERINELLEETE